MRLKLSSAPLRHFCFQTAFKQCYSVYMTRPVGSGAAWRRSPHQKSAEREKKEKGGKKEKRGERKERGEKKKGRGEQKKKKERKKKGRAEGSKRERCIMPMGVKHPLIKIVRDTKRGGWKELKKGRKKGRRDRKGRRRKCWHRKRTDWDGRI